MVFLCGNSFGAMLSFEIAEQLEVLNLKVGFLVHGIIHWHIKSHVQLEPD
jgi:surfactin synthase thioesterase subunit